MDEIHLVQIDSIPCHIPTTPKYYLLRNLFWFMVFKGPFLGFNVIIHNTTRTTALSVASMLAEEMCLRDIIKTRLAPPLITMVHFMSGDCLENPCSNCVPLHHRHLPNFSMPSKSPPIHLPQQ